MSFLKNVFYPSGKYNKLYGSYIKWTFLSNIISSTEDSISTHCLLSTLGSVNNDIVVSYNYIGKNLIGQIGGLFFVSKFGNTIDKEPKKHFYTSIGLNQLAIYIDCFMPLFTFNSNVSNGK